MAEVFTIEKAIIAAQHDTFHSEVITGKAGGLASGADIETATNAVTGQVQTTLPKVLRDVGFKPASFNFVTGGTLGIADADKCIYNPAPAGDDNWYSWGGNIPHDVAAGTDPAAVGSGYVPRADVVLRQQINTDFPESYGAAANGSTDDTSAIASSIAGAGASSYLRKGAKYLVTAISNALGKPFTGPGHIVKAVTGGLEAQTTYADRYQRVTGQEYLAAWYNLLTDQVATVTRSVKIVFSGDSTTAGVGVDADYQIHAMVQRGIAIKGCAPRGGVVCVNSGHSGSPTQDFDSTYADQDAALNPDLYVVRWGINDPGYLNTGLPAPLDAGQSYPGRRDVSDFAASLRSGLTKFRALKPFSQCSILLMMPNSTYDIPNARDALWYEQLHNVYVQAARDFQCAFIDTYAVMQDSRQLANILMDDPMSTSGRGIHPNNAMNSVIAGHIVDLVAPSGMLMSTRFPSNSILNVSGSELTPLSSLLPDSYKAHMYTVRCLTANGWPMDGNAIAFRTNDDTLIQYHFGYLDADRGKLLVRFGRATVLGGESANWSAWYDVMGKRDIALVTPGAGFTIPASNQMKIAYSGTHAVINGSISMTTPAIIAQNRVLCVIPAGMAPLSVAFGVATLFDGVSTFEQRPVNISSTGEVFLAMASSISPSVIYVSITFDNRA